MTGLPKLPSTVSDIFKGEKLSQQKKLFPSVSDFELMIFEFLVKKFGRLTKTALYVSRGDFRREKILKLKSFFRISLWIWAVDFQDSGEKRRKYHQSCILPVQANILLRKCFGEKEFNTCGFLGKKSQISGGKVSRRKFLREHFLQKRYFESIIVLGEKVSNFSPKVPIRAVRTAFYVSKGWILGKTTGSIQFSDFLGHRAKLLGLYAKSFLQDYQLFILLDQRMF